LLPTVNKMVGLWSGKDLQMLPECVYGGVIFR
jgi:hypothetical protein